MQTTLQFEEVIKGHVNTYRISPRRSVQALTCTGLEVARAYLLTQTSDTGCAGVIKRAAKLETLRALAWNLAIPGSTERLRDGQPVQTFDEYDRATIRRMLEG